MELWFETNFLTFDCFYLDFLIACGMEWNFWKTFPLAEGQP